jgi:competence protein ComEA
VIESLQQPAEAESPAEADVISIFVNGSVNAPGVYQLPAESRVQQAVTAAQGFSADAFVDGVNLAAFLADGMQVYIPSQAQGAEYLNQLLTAPLQGGGGTVITAGGLDAVGGLVNINTADKALLETIPGIGPATAQSILDYREDNGSFAIIEDIMNVSGIGEGKFEQMRNVITVGP